MGSSVPLAILCKCMLIFWQVSSSFANDYTTNGEPQEQPIPGNAIELVLAKLDHLQIKQLEMEQVLKERDGEITEKIHNLETQFSLAGRNLTALQEQAPYDGTAGNSLTNHAGMKFTTKDRDNDKYPANCASTYEGAWWYNACYNSNLNGSFARDCTTSAQEHSIPGNAIELVLAKVDHLQIKQLEMKLGLQKRDDERLEKMQNLETQFNWVGHNLTALQEKFRKILARQVVCSSHKQLRKEISKLSATKRPSTIGQLLTTVPYLQDSMEKGPLKSCKEAPANSSGVNSIKMGEEGGAFDAFCEQNSFGGGWLVIQYRFDGSLDFYRNWTEYRNGFGDIKGEFWIGLEKIHQLTSSRPYELMVEMKDFQGNHRYAHYPEFEIGSEAEQYPLKKLGDYNGTAGDSLTYHAGMKFSTKDRDNDKYAKNCATMFEGAWWYKGCYNSHLNGRYLNKDYGKTMFWYYFKNPHQELAYSRMMIRQQEQPVPGDAIELVLAKLDHVQIKQLEMELGLKELDEKEGAFDAFCEQNSFGGGWLVIQYRFDGSLDFYRNWTEYRNGFGDINREFWIGLEKIHQLTASRPHELMVEIKDFDGNYRYAHYSAFEIGSESRQYPLKKLGAYDGTAGNSLTNHAGMKFTTKDLEIKDFDGSHGYAQYKEFEIGSETELYVLKKISSYTGTASDSLGQHIGSKFTTKDRDNDMYDTNCAVASEGAWWYHGCHYANLNGRYSIREGLTSMCWYHYKNRYQGLAYSRMMMREIDG
uniref:Fibrinogen C-terminal domain-containing protein n=1 Tax=Anopheles atroparvus TaxID=41427 RepID=A0A182J0G1_ANOAO